MIRIDRVTLREIRLPLREPFAISSGVQELRRILLLEVRDRDGRTAWSECVAPEYPNYSPETIDTAWLALREWLIPLLQQADLPGHEAVHQRLDAQVRGHQMAKASLEMAAWHLEALSRDTSLARLLGGTQPRVPVGISVGIQPAPEVLLEKISAYREQGYRKIKLKIKPGADSASLEAVRTAFGATLPLAADANAAYTLADADHLRSLDAFDLMMLEQPLHPEDLLRHARLQKQLRTQICLDESITSLDRAEDMIALGSGRIINVKPGRVGGLTSAKAIHDLCAAHEMPVWCGGMLESGIGRAYNVALASLPNFTIPGDISPSRRYWEEDVVTPEWTMSADGFVEVPFDRPGLGIEIDRARIEKLTVRREEVRREAA